MEAEKKSCMKTFVLVISKTFPKGHPKEGKLTGFKNKIKAGIKIHTIRENHALWEKRIEEVRAGSAVLSLRQWQGVPYRSPQKEFLRLTKDNNIGIQKITCRGRWEPCRRRWELNGQAVPIEELAAHDGLNAKDFTMWFKNSVPFAPLALIHFTGFRYFEKLEELEAVEEPEQPRPPLSKQAKYAGARRAKTEAIQEYAGRITSLFQDYLVYDITDREWIQAQNKLEELIVEIRNA
jgi:hypothetical protein